MVHIVPWGKLFTGSCQTLALSGVRFGGQIVTGFVSNYHTINGQVWYEKLWKYVIQNEASNWGNILNVCVLFYWEHSKFNYISKFIVDKDGWLQIGKLSNNCVELKETFLWIFIVTKLDRENRIFCFCYVCSRLSINNTSCYFRTNRSLITISLFQMIVNIFSKRIDIWQSWFGCLL